MVRTVLDFVEQWLQQHVLQALRTEGEPQLRLERMCDQLSELYEGGQQPCLSAILLSGSARDVFQTKVQLLYRAWIEAIATVLIEAGLPPQLARERGEDAVIVIQGALILVHALDDLTPFQRVIKQLPKKLCQDQ